MFYQVAGKPEKTRSLKRSLDSEGLVVGCQGLHFYLQKNLASVREKKEIPVLFLIPGSLDYYHFRLRYLSETEMIVNLKIEIDNFFLRLFVPSLVLVYDKEGGRLNNYVGLSHIKSDKGDPCKVRIDYEYQ